MERPAFDVDRVATGVVHLGIGAFHRAHQAMVFDDILGTGDYRWGVVGASLRSGDVRDRLMPQSGLYTLVEHNGDHARHRVVGAIRDVIVAKDTPRHLLHAMASAATHIVTLTVTEKGYLHHPLGKGAADYIVAALALRRARGLMPFTTMSCDNLSGNGAAIGRAVMSVAESADPALHDWIATHAAFPDTMVDRIVPATDDTDIDRLATILGVEDRAMVKTEPFWQWVVEDRFCGLRPDFEAVGVQVVADVAPFEVAKLRLLNGAHSGLAYLGALAGYEFVHKAVLAPAFAAFVDRLWAESRTTFPAVAGFDIDRYCAKLTARFTNSALDHRLRQIAVDGSQKIPQRLVAPIGVRLSRNQGVDALALAVAAWMRWQTGRDESGMRFAVDDPLAARTAELVSGAGDAKALVGALLTITEVFGDLHAHPVLVERLSYWLDILLTRGAAAAVHQLTD